MRRPVGRVSILFGDLVRWDEEGASHLQFTSPNTGNFRTLNARPSTVPQSRGETTATQSHSEPRSTIGGQKFTPSATELDRFADVATIPVAGYLHFPLTNIPRPSAHGFDLCSGFRTSSRVVMHLRNVTGRWQVRSPQYAHLYREQRHDL